MRLYLPAIVSIAAALPIFAIAACDETIPATKAAATDSGTDSGGSTSDGGGGDSGPGSSLFQRLDGEPGITAFVNAVIAKEIEDAEIASYFAPNTLATPPNGKPTVTQIKECLVKQIAAAAGGPGITYPTAVSGGYMCRDMESSHASLHIGSGLFDKFAAIAAGVAAASGLSGSDLTTVSTFLQANKSLIVDENAPDGGFFDSGIVIDSGTDAPADAGEDG